MIFCTPKFLRGSIFALTENLNLSKQRFMFFRTCYSTDNIPEIDNHSSQSKTKILKVAIIGDPNAGKSTLINNIVGKNVFAMSNKVHTTRCRARAVYVKGNTQLVFLDTPGLVTNTESKKHHLDHTYITDGEEAVKEADVIGVVHDVANKYTIFKLSQKVLRLLHFYSSKPSFLILNKVDCMKSKRDLLDCVKILANKNRDPRDEIYLKESLTENELQNMLKDEVGWSHFRDIFMVSALDGNGVGDIREYLLDLAKPGDWLFSSDDITDQKDITLIQNVVFAKLLDELNNEIAYNLSIHIDYFNKGAEGDLYVAVLIGCSKPRIERLILGKGGARVLKITRSIEQDLCNFFFESVHVRLVVTNKEEVERYGAPTRIPPDVVDANLFENASG